MPVGSNTATWRVGNSWTPSAAGPGLRSSTAESAGPVVTSTESVAMATVTARPRAAADVCARRYAFRTSDSAVSTRARSASADQGRITVAATTPMMLAAIMVSKIVTAPLQFVGDANLAWTGALT